MNENSQIVSSDKLLKAISPLGYPSQLIAPGESFESVTEEIGSIVLQPRQPKSWWFGAMLAFALLMLFFFAISYLLYRGVGIWGINIPVAWGFCNRQFCLVDRHWSRGNLHFRNFAFTASKNGELRSIVSPRQ